MALESDKNHFNAHTNEEKQGITRKRESVTPVFEPSSYHYWRQSLYDLQLSHTKVETVSDSISEGIGRSGYAIGQRTILELREGRTTNGKPYVLCVDEVPDSQVLQGATTQERMTAFTSAIGTVPESLFLNTSEQVDAYVLAAIPLASTVLGITLDKAKETVTNGITASALSDELKTKLVHSMQHVSERTVTEVILCLAESKKRVIAEEVAQNKRRNIEVPGIEYQGRSVAVPGNATKEVVLSARERQHIPFLRLAVHTSRDAMIQAALYLAEQYSSYSYEQLQQVKLPNNWLQANDFEGLKSNEVLVFRPFIMTEQELAAAPSFISMHPYGGWYKMKIPHGDYSLKMPVIRLSK